jgi:hypothetical protein
MKNGLTTQTVSASRLSVVPGRATQVIDERDPGSVRAGGLGDALRDNVRRKRVLLDEIHRAAGAGQEDEVIRLAATLAEHRARTWRLAS